MTTRSSTRSPRSSKTRTRAPSARRASERASERGGRRARARARARVRVWLLPARARVQPSSTPFARRCGARAAGGARARARARRCNRRSRRSGSTASLDRFKKNVDSGKIALIDTHDAFATAHRQWSGTSKERRWWMQERLDSLRCRVKLVFIEVIVTDPEVIPQLPAAGPPELHIDRGGRARDGRRRRGRRGRRRAPARQAGDASRARIWAGSSARTSTTARASRPARRRRPRASRPSRSSRAPRSSRPTRPPTRPPARSTRRARPRRAVSGGVDSSTRVRSRGSIELLLEAQRRRSLDPSLPSPGAVAHRSVETALNRIHVYGRSA